MNVNRLVCATWYAEESLRLLGTVPLFGMDDQSVKAGLGAVGYG